MVSNNVANNLCFERKPKNLFLTFTKKRFNDVDSTFKKNCLSKYLEGFGGSVEL